MEQENTWYVKTKKLYVTIKSNNTKNDYLEDVTKENIKEHNSNWLQIPDHPYKILIMGGSGSGKINSSFNLSGCQSDLYKNFLCAKDQKEAKYQYLINKREGSGLKSILIILKLLLNIQMIWMIFMKTLKNTIQIRNAKY